MNVNGIVSLEKTVAKISAAQKVANIGLPAWTQQLDNLVQISNASIIPPGLKAITRINDLFDTPLMRMSRDINNQFVNFVSPMQNIPDWSGVFGLENSGLIAIHDIAQKSDLFAISNKLKKIFEMQHNIGLISNIPALPVLPQISLNLLNIPSITNNDLYRPELQQLRTLLETIDEEQVTDFTDSATAQNQVMPFLVNILDKVVEVDRKIDANEIKQKKAVDQQFWMGVVAILISLPGFINWLNDFVSRINLEYREDKTEIPVTRKEIYAIEKLLSTPDWETKITTSNVFLREKPLGDKNDNILARISKNSKVTALSSIRRWNLVAFTNNDGEVKTGWVSKRYLK